MEKLEKMRFERIGPEVFDFLEELHQSWRELKIAGTSSKQFSLFSYGRFNHFFLFL